MADTTVTVIITDVMYPQDRDEGSGVSNSTVALKVRVIDSVHISYGELEEWVPLNMDVYVAMLLYGSTLKNKRAKMRLPYFPSILGAHVTRIVSPMYQQEEYSGEALANEGFISAVAKTRNLGVF